MSGNRTAVIVIGAIVLVCFCIIVISIAAGGYLFLNQKNPVTANATLVPFPINPLPQPTSQVIPNPPSIPPVAANAACDDVQEFDDQGYDHILPGQPHPPYNSNPPTSGWHWADPQDWGVYSRPQTQEQLVHNLEHGGIVIQYNNLTAGELARLLDFVSKDPHHIVVAPYPGLDPGVRVAFTAWTYLQDCDGVDLGSLADFIDEFRDQGPESVP